MQVIFLADEISQNNLQEVDGEIFQYLSLFLANLNGDFHWLRAFGSGRPKGGRASFRRNGDERV
jgi:hypothetical protein